METWKDIPGFEGKYLVSNMGRVKSLKRDVYFVRYGEKIQRFTPEKILKPNIDKDGYCIYRLYLNGVGIYCKGHRLVALSFLGKSDLTVNHINGNAQDNRLENLEYLTISDNAKDAYRRSLIKGRKKPKGPNPYSIKTAKALYGKFSKDDLAYVFCISKRFYKIAFLNSPRL